MRGRIGGRFLVAMSLLLFVPAMLQAAELLTLQLDMREGSFSPARLAVPAGVKFKIVLHNKGQSAAEFESVELRKEKVLAPGAQSFVVIAPLRSGTYVFFDDFHPDMPKGAIMAQ